MAAVATILVPDIPALTQWQLLKKPTIVNATPSALQLTQTFEDVSISGTADAEALDVSTIGALRLQCWGEGDNNDVPIINLYGWQRGGPGHHIGTITLAMGNFTSTGSTINAGFHRSSVTHQSIRDAFTEGTTYRGCDTYTKTNDFENAITVYTGESDFPGHADITFVNNQYQYFSIFLTGLGSPAATNVGAIFKALSVKKGYSTPQFTN